MPETETELAESSVSEHDVMFPWVRDVKESGAGSLWIVCTVMYFANTIYVSWHGMVDWQGAPYGLAMLAAMFVVNWVVLFATFAIYMCVGLSKADAFTALGERSKWDMEQVQYFLDTYGERRIKITDAIVRRSGHVIGGLVMWMAFIPFAVPTQSMRVAAMECYTPLKVLVRLVLMGSDGYIAMSYWKGTRIRDGRLGRINMTCVNFVCMGFYPVATTIIQFGRFSVHDAPYMMSYMWQPNTWGDAFAEIIGSFFGKHEFQVRGFGDINKKTVEGVVACWTATFISCSIYTSTTEFPASSFRLPILYVNVIAATVATIAETVSLRGTDNGVMVLSIALLLMWMYIPDAPVVPGGDAFPQNEKRSRPGEFDAADTNDFVRRLQAKGEVPCWQVPRGRGG